LLGGGIGARIRIKESEKFNKKPLAIIWTLHQYSNRTLLKINEKYEKHA